jgi:hypothetical protein
MKKLLPIILGLALSSSAFAVDELKPVDELQAVDESKDTVDESLQIRGTKPNERYIGGNTEDGRGRKEERRDRKEEKKGRKEEKKEHKEERREEKKEHKEERREHEGKRGSTQPVAATRVPK